MESEATTLPEVIQEMLLTKQSERQGRVIDYDQSGSMEEKKTGGLLLMSHQSDLIESDIIAYLKQHERKELLRLLTCGSVDDGKSTLIGRRCTTPNGLLKTNLRPSPATASRAVPRVNNLTFRFW